ncbi:SusC/RagA family TonB-linked outer membrane protein [Marinilabilia rubra]|uniref:TonB-dependent receptor n=1 Tax=Marinilabilia rubra TaxID=2162893 RepID=A0A2U2B3P1_9BACT|nr:TonB-dependent receptor [Marinilabilia rubra]PWD97664.1 TonB-dependent receptor [Marinilabilia rubra]
MKKIRSFLEGDLLKKVKSGGRKILTGLLIALGATFLCTIQSLAQETKTVTGTVTDTQGGLLPGVNVVIKGTLQGAITDVDGNYQIQASADDVLQFSFIGFQTLEVPVGDQTTIDVSLQEQTSDLDEVVVVGYGVQQKSLVTGAISSVDAEELANAPASRVEQAMQGRTAGVTVLPTSGSPGSGAKVRIRGTNSNSNSDPLYIVDGMKVGSIENIAPSNIESIEVLKDAASSAIYGSEGGNGVVIINTKKGKKGEGKISYNFQYGIQDVDTKMELMDAQEYAQYMDEQGTDVTVPGNVGNGTNWLDEIFEKAPMQRHNLSFTGGGEKSSFLASVSYNQQDGVVGGEKAAYERLTFRLNSSHDIKDWIEVGNTLSYTHSKRNVILEDDEYNSPIVNALLVDPTTPVLYEEGETPQSLLDLDAAGNPLVKDDQGRFYAVPLNTTGEIGNPVARLELYNRVYTRDQLTGTVFANVKPIDNLTITSRLGLDLTYQQNHNWNETFYFFDDNKNVTPSINDDIDKYFNWLWENFATYDMSFNDHSLTVMGGYSAEQRLHPNWTLYSSPMLKESDRYAYHSFTTSRDNDVVGGGLEEQTMTSIYGRLSYNYLGKYMFQTSVRRDAASVFPENDKGAIFPAASIGWVMSEESFWDDTFMDYFKVRASWGQNGSISALTGTEDKAWWTVSGIFYPNANEDGYFSGAQIEKLTNDDLKWERTEQLSVGADMRFLDRKMNLSVDYYDKQTKDLIVTAPFPLSVGNDFPFVNGGDVSNSGFEFELGYNDSFGDFNLSANLNLSTLKNEVTYLKTDAPIAGANIRGYNITWFAEGEPIWYFNGYKTDGIDADTGLPNIVDTDDSGDITPADMTNIGDPHPDLLYGASISAEYKGVDLRVFLQGTKGNEIYTGWFRPDRAESNKPKYLFDGRWTPSNTNASMPRAEASSEYVYRSDYMVQDGSYTRIKQIQLGYNLPVDLIQQIGMSKARIYISLDDYFTFTDYKGLDPEAGSSNNQSQGVDRGVYPIPRKMMFGLSVNF